MSTSRLTFGGSAGTAGFFRRDPAGEEGLAYMIGDYLICAVHPSGSGNVLTLCQQELSISGPAVTSIAGDKSAIIRLLRVGRIVSNIADCLAFRAAFVVPAAGHSKQILRILDVKFRAFSSEIRIKSR